MGTAARDCRTLRGETWTDTNSDVPNVKIVPALVYLAALAVGFLANVWAFHDLSQITVIITLLESASIDERQK